MTTRELPPEVYAAYVRDTGKGVLIEYDTEAGRIALHCAYTDRDKAKAIGGGRWDATGKRWLYPADAATARALIETFEGAAATLPPHLMGQGGLPSRSAPPATPPAPPEPKPYTGVEPQPWSFQRRAYDFAYDKPGVLLALKMGRGKSRVAVDLVMNRRHKRTLILCPLSVVPVWPSQFERWAQVWPAVVALDKGSVAAKTAAAQEAFNVTTRPVVVVINYESAFREPFASWALKQDWDCVIADESHKLKSPSGAQSRFASRLTKRASQRIALTGTPMPHSPLDIYAQYRFLDPGIYGSSFVRFRNRYAVMGGYQMHEVKGFQRMDELEALMGRIAFVLPEGEDIDLPEAQHIYLTCELEPRGRKVYDDLQRDLVVRIGDGEITASNALVELLRLQQITSGFLMPEGGDVADVDVSKANLLRDTLDGLAGDEPVVVFGRFRYDMDTVHSVCRALGRDSLELSGRVNQLAEWQAGGAPVLAVQIQAGGVGIDLTRAAYAVYYSLGFSLGDFDQSLARVHRPGQTRKTTYYHLLARDTVDEAVYGALRQRRQVVETVIDHLKGTK